MWLFVCILKTAQVETVQTDTKNCARWNVELLDFDVTVEVTDIAEDLSLLCFQSIETTSKYTQMYSNVVYEKKIHFKQLFLNKMMWYINFMRSKILSTLKTLILLIGFLISRFFFVFVYVFFSSFMRIAICSLFTNATRH